MITDAKTRDKVIESILKAVNSSDLVGPRSFDKPRHGIRVTYKGKDLDMLISFGEAWAVLYYDGKEVKWVRLTKEPAKLLDAEIKR